MNMMRHDWPMLDKAVPVAAKPHGRAFSAGAVVLAHIVLVVALVWYRAATPPAPVLPPQPIMIDLVASQAVKPATIAPLKFVNPLAPVIAMPDVVLEAPQHAITVQIDGHNSASPALNASSGGDYYARLLTYLESRKRYPPEARRLHIEGTVRVQFRIDRTGRVLSFAVVGSSGRPILDAEAKALIARAQPLPAPPADFTEAALNLVVPVEFRLH